MTRGKGKEDRSDEGIKRSRKRKFGGKIRKRENEEIEGRAAETRPRVKCVPIEERREWGN